MYDGNSIMERQERMARKHQTWRNICAEIGSLLIPRQSNFQTTQQFGSTSDFIGEIFDEFARLKFEQGVSIARGLANPEGQVWERFELEDDSLMAKQHIRLWCEQKNILLQGRRNDGKSGFGAMLGEGWASLLAFGAQSCWIDIRRDILGNAVGISYQPELIGGVYVEENAEGVPTYVNRRFWLSARQAWDKWGEQSPAIVRKKMGEKGKGVEDEMVEFIHAIMPNTEYDPDRLDYRGKPWRGCYMAVEGREVFEHGGYHTMPRIVSRWLRSNGVAEGAAFKVLPSIKSTQQMMVDLMTAAENQAMPPLGAHSDMMDQTINYAAREVSYGAIGPRGERRVVPLIEGAQMGEAMALYQRICGYIEEAFFIPLLSINQDLKSHVTDAQIYERKADAGVLLTPLANQHNEWFSAMLDRELALMDELGDLDDMPDEVTEAVESGVGLRVIYDNGVTRAQQAGAVGAYFDLERFFAGRFQTDPASLQTFQQKYPFAKVLDYVGRATGVPVAIEASDEERATAEEADAQANASADLLKAMPDLAASARDLGAALPAGVM